VKEGDIETVKDYRVGVKCRHLFTDMKRLKQILLKGAHDIKSTRFNELISFFNFFDGHYDTLSLVDPLPFVYEITEPLGRRIVK
jgi:hypothetical protein